MKNLIILLLLSTLISCSKEDVDTKDSSKKQSTEKTSKKDKKDKKGKNKKEEEVVINVEATKVYTGDAVLLFKTTTILEADLESAVTSKASGIILKVNVEVGDKVQAGDVLAVLESDVQQLRYASAEANYQKVLNNFKRAKSLLKKGLANKESVDNLNFETKSLKTSLQQAKLDLDFTKIKAPISGVVTKRNIKKGNLIQTNTQVYEIVNFDSLQAVINVPEDKWNVFKEGLEVDFIFTSMTETVKGHILRIDPIVDSTTGTFKVVIALDEDASSQYHLRPGLFGKTQIILNKHANTLLVSKNAVIREDDNAFVYEINSDNTVTKRNLVLGYEMDDALEITSGIEVDKRVVTTGKNNISEESKVEVIEYKD
jgi:RND family efflux transporter MFP subunit